MKRLLLALVAICCALPAYAATLLPNGEQTFVDASGTPLAGGFVYFYIPGTTSPKDTWQDAGQSILNANPVTLDSAGRAVIYGAGTYREVLKDTSGNTIWDQLTADSASTATSWAGTSGGSANAQTANAANFSSQDGQEIAFIAGFTNTGATTLSLNGAGPINILKDTAAGSVSLTGGEIVAGNVVQVVYGATSGAFHLLTFPAPSVVYAANSLLANLTGSAAAPANVTVPNFATALQPYILPGGLIGIQKFTTSGTYTPSSNTAHAMVFVTGGGGGAGGGTGSTNTGAGGGAGATAIAYIGSPASTTVTIGAAGSAGAGANGGNGGATSFGSISANGGVGGVDGTGRAVGGLGATTTSGALLGISGGDGGPTTYASGNASGGIGGASFWGGGGTAGTSDTTNGFTGKAFGSGGGGCVGSCTGGAGAPGVVLILEFGS